MPRNKFFSSIKCLSQPEASLLEEQHNIENAPVIPNTSQMHQLVIEIGEDGKTKKMTKVDPVSSKVTKISSNAVILTRHFNHVQ